MKQPIKDALQIIVALLITGSTAYAMQPSQVQPPMKLASKVVQHSVSHAKPLVKPAVASSKTVNTAVVVPPAPQSPQNAPQSTVTWQSNPNNCTADQWISATAPFSCIDKPTATASAPAVASPVGTTYSGCGDNSYANAIYMWETGCKLVDPNSEGCDGIGQACPASKIYAACPDMDYACQNAWFTNYAISRYGSWANAYAFHLANGWW